MYTPETLWTVAREKADVTMVVMKNDSYAILNIELARAREGYEGRLAGLRAGARAHRHVRLRRQALVREAGVRT
jgi:thiamine pyrophosphate-dependent acetolactate synthase large subunit-like protein